MTAETSGRASEPFIVGLNKVLGGVEAAALVGAAACVLGVLVITTADVIGRYAFDNSLGWAYDGALVLLVGLCFLSAATVQAQNGNVAVHFVHRLFPRNGRRWLGCVQLAATAAVFAAVGWMNLGYTLDAWAAGWVYGGFGVIPTWVPYSFIALGSFLVSLRALLQGITVVVDDPAAQAIVDPENDGLNT